jgi:peptidoglycan/xylan/chitin deacetylase (PgdA/CDA1 family)
MKTTGRPRQTFEQVLSSLRGERLRVLSYRSISVSYADRYAVSPQAFAQQMAWLAASGYKVIPIRDLLTGIRVGVTFYRTVALTFDGGLADFYAAALPVLRRHRFPAAVFVPAGLLGGRQPAGPSWPERQVMQAAQIYYAAEKGIEIGCLGVSGEDLTRMSPGDLVYELCDSLRFLRSLTGQPEMALAYPQGLGGRREAAAARTAGFSGAFLSDGMWGIGRDSDLFALGRTPVTQDLTLENFSRLVSGSADFSRLFARLIPDF